MFTKLKARKDVWRKTLTHFSRSEKKGVERQMFIIVNLRGGSLFLYTWPVSAKISYLFSSIRCCIVEINRYSKILRRKRLLLRDFLNTK